MQLTKEQARELIDAHEIDSLFKNDEERELLQENNPELFSAYQALMKIADKCEGCDKPPVDCPGTEKCGYVGGDQD